MRPKSKIAPPSPEMESGRMTTAAERSTSRLGLYETMATKEYRTIQRCYDRLIETLCSTVDPPSFARKLRQKALISDDIVQYSEEHVPTDRLKITRIMAAVQAHMKLDGGLFQPFMDVLKSMDSPLWNLLHSCYSSNLELNAAEVVAGVTDWKELGHQLGISPIKTSLLCGDTEHCREKVVQEWLKEGKTASWEKLCTALEQMGREEEVQAIKERYLVTSKHAPEPKESVSPRTFDDQIEGISEQRKKLESRFSNLVCRLKDEMLKNRLTMCMSSFRHSVMHLPTTVRSDHYQFISEYSKDITKAEDIEDLFLHLNLYWTYLEYSLLSHIIECHSDTVSEELRRDMSNYERDMKVFKTQTTVKELLEVGVWSIRSDPPPGFSRIVTKLDQKPAEYTLEALDEFRRKICFKFNLPSFILMLESVGDGSLWIHWHIPSSEVHHFTAEFVSLADLKQISEEVFHLSVDMSTLSYEYTDIFADPVHTSSGHASSFHCSPLSLTSSVSQNRLLSCTPLLLKTESQSLNTSPLQWRGQDGGLQKGEAELRQYHRRLQVIATTEPGKQEAICEPVYADVIDKMANPLFPKDLGKVLKDTFAARSKWYYIGLELEVEASELDAIKANHSDVDDCYLETLKVWLKGVAPKPTWDALAEALASDMVKKSDLAVKLRDKYCYSVGMSLDTSGHCHGLQTEEVELRDCLRHLQRMGNVAITAPVIQEAIHKYASTCLSLGASIDHVTDQLQRLCRDELHISEGLYRQALQDAIDLHPALTEAAVASKPIISEHQPLFNKDTVYHAGICSLAVCTRDAGNYQQFFKDKELVRGHSLTGVSLSRSKQDRYLIARQGDSTVYLGFQSEPLLLEWSKQFKSFGKGITAQSDKFPVRFIVDLLNKQQHIVLTGFSFGGLLAAALTARVWETPYFPVALLKQNLVCITFGQPHVTVPMLECAAAQNPELASCIHSFYCEDDPVPRLLRVLDRSWSQEDTNKGRKSHVVPPLDPFDDPVTRGVFDSITKLQQMNPEDEGYSDLLMETVSRMKRVLEKLDPGSSGAGKMVSSTFHLIATHPRTGLTCCRLSQDQAALQCGFLTPDDLEALVTGARHLFEQHSPIVYIRKKLFRAFLEKEPNYTFPSAQKLAPPIVPNLKPTIEAVKIRHHGDRTSVAVEGENFWFCYNVTVGHDSRRFPSQDFTGSSIQFDGAQHKISTATESGKVIVSLQSLFFKTVNQEVQVDEKKYDMSTRQQQLARLTPSQLIELAYLCALLEQHPYGKYKHSSHKLEVIKSFLERVVHVVPLESVAFAVADGSNETAEMCSQVLMGLHSRITIPSSEMFVRTLGFAIEHIKTGVPASVLKKMHVEAYQKLPVPAPKLIGSKFERDSDTLTLSLVARTPGGYPIPLLKPLSVVKIKCDETAIKVNHVSKTMADLLYELWIKMGSEEDLQGITLISGLNIEKLYPVSRDLQQQQHCPALNSPLDTLVDGRKKLGDLRVVTASHQASKPPSSEPVVDRQKCNQLMLQSVNDIRKREVATCATLLGGFMEQENMAIKLLNSRKMPSGTIHLTASGSIGVWALFSFDYSQMKSILAQCRDKQALVGIGDYVKATLGSDYLADNSQYAAKLQFFAQGMRKTVTCNSQYVSYSLEQKLAEMCKQYDIDAISVDTLLLKWHKLFKDNVLSLVHYHSRPLIARWLKWAIMIHKLREALVDYTAIGVVGLTKSGKSELVKTLFGIEIPVGTDEISRTTVPFLYNLDKYVKGLDVVDFPGVDDEDDTIPDLADLLVTVAQIVIFVVDYRRVGSQYAKQWLDRLQREKVPVLVCLTFADKFYAEYMSEDGQHLTKAEMEFRLQYQLIVTQKKLGSGFSHEVKFFSFSQDRDSVLNSPDGRRRLEKVGIGSPRDVGAWLVRVFREDFGQESLANRLEYFIATSRDYRTVF